MLRCNFYKIRPTPPPSPTPTSGTTITLVLLPMGCDERKSVERKRETRNFHKNGWWKGWGKIKYRALISFKALMRRCRYRLTLVRASKLFARSERNWKHADERCQHHLFDIFSSYPTTRSLRTIKKRYAFVTNYTRYLVRMNFWNFLSAL